MGRKGGTPRVIGARGSPVEIEADGLRQKSPLPLPERGDACVATGRHVEDILRALVCGPVPSCGNSSLPPHAQTGLRGTCRAAAREVAHSIPKQALLPGNRVAGRKAPRTRCRTRRASAEDSWADRRAPVFGSPRTRRSHRAAAATAPAVPVRTRRRPHFARGDRHWSQT